jgi:hypothetical protein
LGKAKPVATLLHIEHHDSRQSYRLAAVPVLRNEIAKFLGFKVPEFPAPFETHVVVEEQGYTRNLIGYKGREGDDIPAFLLMPKVAGPFPAVFVHHQHNGERHLGKSEGGMCLPPWKSRSDWNTRDISGDTP